MVDLPPGFRVKAQQPVAASAPAAIPAIPEGFTVKGAAPVDPNAGWQEPGMLAPVQFKEGTGEMRWAVPRIVTDTINAVSAPGKAARGEYGIEVDPETGRPTAITNDMISDTMGLAGIVGLEPAAQVGAQFGKGMIKPGAIRMIQRELANAGIDPAQVPSIMRSMGPNTMVADLSPGLQARAAAIATMPGSGQKTIVDALAARRAGANVRIQTGVNDVLGPAPIPSYLQADITANKKALSPYYKEVLAGPDVRAVDTQPVADTLDAMAINERGASQALAASVRKMLNVTGEDLLDPSPETLLATRQTVGGLLSKAQTAIEKDPTYIGALKHIYGQLDEALTKSVPGIKDVDAQYQELARQSEAIDTGPTILNTDNDALRPREVEDLMNGGGPQYSRTEDGGPVPKGTLIGPSAVPLRLSQGARARIDAIVGNGTNDIQAMKKVLQGEGNWNRDRLATVFGKEKAAALLDIFEQEARQHATEEMALRGSRTDVLRSAKVDIEGGGAKSPNPIISLLDFKPGTATRDLIDNGFGWLSANKRASTNSQVAQALMARAADAPLMKELAIPARDGRKAVNLALLRAMALGNEGYAESFGTPYRAVSGR